MNWKTLSHLSTRKIKNIQNKKLRYFIQHKVPFSPYYNDLFKENKIRFSDIKTTDDLRKIPFTTKNDIAPTKNNPKKHANFVLQPNKESIKKYSSKLDLLKYALNKNSAFKEFNPVHLHFTTGRTANAVPFLYTAYDLEKLRESGKRMMNILDINKDNKLINAFPYAPHLAFWATFFAAEASGLFALHTGGGKILGTDKIIKSIQSTKATLLAAIPGFAYHLLREAKNKKADFSSVKKIFFGGERVSKGLREKIRSMLTSLGSKNPEIFATYAFTEGKVAWAECKENSGYHLYPDMEFIEIIDKNGEDVGENEKGEIVYTALDFRGTIVLRYKTGDVGSITYEKCSCGRTLPRLSSEIERSSEIKEFNLTKVKGTLVNLNAFFEILNTKEIEEWQVEIKKKNNDPYELDELIVYISPKKNIDFIKLKSKLKKILYDELEITPQIVKMDLKEILDRLGMETELKEKRIIDNRPKT
ncbi:MAG: phenylacetate--CoA ligase family protein [Nanoarchaeota archaeon]|nr:phenylacetate--CoA ligase family protein [Nanoarchaeota archaeon]